jgi:hypothetical protein
MKLYRIFSEGYRGTARLILAEIEAKETAKQFRVGCTRATGFGVLVVKREGEPHGDYYRTESTCFEAGIRSRSAAIEQKKDEIETLRLELAEIRRGLDKVQA